jgi:hypothetical protein
VNRAQAESPPETAILTRDRAIANDRIGAHGTLRSFQMVLAQPA